MIDPAIHTIHELASRLEGTPRVSKRGNCYAVVTLGDCTGSITRHPNREKWRVNWPHPCWPPLLVSNKDFDDVDDLERYVLNRRAAANELTEAQRLFGDTP